MWLRLHNTVLIGEVSLILSVLYREVLRYKVLDVFGCVLSVHV